MGAFMDLIRISRRKWLVCGAAIFCTALTCGQAAAQTGRLAGQELRIGAIVPSSGPFAEWGRSNTVTLKMLEDEINASGGVEGAKVRIIVYDDASRPPQAANLVRRLAEDDKVLAIAGPLTSSTVEVAFPVANEMKVVAMSQASSKPGVAALNRPWGFRNTVDEMVLGRASVPFFKNAYNISTVAVIYDGKDANSVALGRKIMPSLMKENGIKVLNEENLLTFNTGDIDVSAQVTTLRSLNSDGIVVAADYSQAVTVLRELKRQGVIKPVIGGTPLIAAATLKAAPDIPIVAPATFFFAEKAEKGPMEKFAGSLLPLLRQTHGLPAEIEPSMYDANIYEIVSLYLDAVRKTDVTLKPDELGQDREKIRKFVETESFQGFGGRVSFSKDGEASKTFFIVVGKDGKWTEGARGCSGPGGKGC
jgi:branched-chain amino acid transport system substrate-binding protein